VKRVILDTVLWSRIADEGSSTLLGEVLANRGYALVKPPSILLEILQSPDPESRARRVAAMASVRGVRLASEAELCADEFVDVVRKRRPHWLRPMPDTGWLTTTHNYWTNRVWRRAIEELQALYEEHRDSPSQAAARHQFTAQQSNQKSFRDDNFVADYIDARLSAPVEAARTTMGGWDGSEQTMWSVEIGDYYWICMGTGSANRTQREFLGAHLDLRTARSDAADFRKLWFEEIKPADVKRQWLRYAVGYTQLQWKLSASNPRDGQHSMYLPDADVFLTADARFVWTLQAVGRQAPFAFAKPMHVKLAQERHLDRLLDVLDDAADW
jgi:hypothetical protein